MGMPGVPGKPRLLGLTMMLTTQASLGNDTTNWNFSLPVKEALHQADLLGPIGKLTCSEPALASAAPNPMQSFVKGATEKAGAPPGSESLCSLFISLSIKRR